jgi:hypothetical protein
MPRKPAPGSRDEIFQRVAAARCYVDRAVSNPDTQTKLELHAFMAIFHPEVPHEKVRDLARDLKK